jgi:hypothetical protein
MPINGRKIDEIASCWVNSRHWVFEIIIAFKITLTTLAPMTITGHGVGPAGIGEQGSGTLANAVSADSQTNPPPHGPTPTALTGTAEGAQKNKAADAPSFEDSNR